MSDDTVEAPVGSVTSTTAWNCTLAPGWTRPEANLLRLALLKFGCGNWDAIIDSECLVGKSIAQMSMQTQHLLGQQSIKEFFLLHIDPAKVGEENSRREGVERKNGLISNEGNKMTVEEFRKRWKANLEKYGVTREEVAKIVIERPGFRQLQLQHRVHALKEELYQLRMRASQTDKRILEIWERERDEAKGIVDKAVKAEPEDKPWYFQEADVWYSSDGSDES